jgi:hypothetical protein
MTRRFWTVKLKDGSTKIVATKTDSALTRLILEEIVTTLNVKKRDIVDWEWDDEANKQMAISKRGMKKYKKTLSALAKL